MEKVIINKVVADWIEEERKAYNDDLAHLEMVIRTVDNATLNKQGCDIVTLAKAIQYGYEVPYEFKVGDIIRNGAGEVLEIVDTDGITQNTRSIKYIKRHAHDELFKLICKAENREDLKVVSNGSV